jgi:two-component system, NtrC family, sensor kinase
MNAHIIISIFAAFAYLLVAVFVFYQNRSSAKNFFFSLLLLCVAVWQIGVAGIRGAPNPNFAETWGDIFRIGLLFIPAVFLNFSLVFSHPQGMSRISKRILLFSYVASGFFTIINWIDHFAGTSYLAGNVKEYPWGYQTISGPLYSVFIFDYLFCVLLSIFYLIRGYIRSNEYQRQQFRYFFLAISVSFILGSLNFLPMFNVDVSTLGIITILAITAGLFIAAYSVVQNRLMDVSVFMAKGVAYIISIIILAIPATIIMTLLEQHSFQKIETNFTIVILGMGILSVLLFGEIKNQMDKAMRHIFVKDKYFYHQILEDFSRRLVTIVDLNRLLNMLGQTIERSMGISRIYIFLYDSEKEIYHSPFIRSENGPSQEQMVFRFDAPFIRCLRERQQAVAENDFHNLPKDSKFDDLKVIMTQLQAEVCLPLIYLDRLIGFIGLGKKPEGGMYFREDLDLLNSLANQVAIAIENANLYENLKKSQTIMRRADRLASLGTLIAGLAHEIRNPLVSIKTFTQLLPERIDDEEFRNYFLTVASGEIDRLTTLINELLGFAKPTEPNLKGEDVNAIIDKMGFLVSSEAKKKNITITKDLTPNPPLIMVDAEQIKQVLLNIMLNGMQAISSDQGHLWVRTRAVKILREGELEPFVQVEIRDNGIGISKENLDHIFDPFFTTRPDGSGLGLAITHQIVHEHGGFIDVESEIGKGTSFRVNFPLKAGENGGPATK